MGRLSQYFWSIAEEAPTLIAMLACLVVAITRWKRYPKVAMIVAIGLALLIAHMFIFMFVYDLVPPIFLKDAATQTFEETQRTRNILFVVLGLIYNSLKVVGFALLLAGVFMRRPQTPVAT